MFRINYQIQLTAKNFKKNGGRKLVRKYCQINC